MKNVMRIVDVVAFVMLLVAGINYLIAGVFGFNLFAWLFGAEEISVIGRIIYALIGVAALVLIGTIIARVIINHKQKSPKKTAVTTPAGQN